MLFRSEAGKDPGKDVGKSAAKDKPKPATAATAPKAPSAAAHGTAHKTGSAPAVTATVRPTAPAAKPIAAPVLAPATRQHAAPRKPVTPAAVAATSSTPQADKDTLETVIELVRKRKSADATNYAASISDPVARKLAEWIILLRGQWRDRRALPRLPLRQSKLAVADFPAPPP